MKIKIMLNTKLQTVIAAMGILHAIFIFAIAVPAQDNESVSPAVKIYLENALDIMQKNSLLRKDVNWEKLRRETFERAKGARETIDTWDAIRFALKSIGDHHSFLQLTEDLSQKEDARGQATNKKVEVPKSQVLSQYLSRRQPESFLHKTGNCVVPRIVVPMFASQRGDGFATSLNKFIAAADAQNPCGWIVDLRGNNGGNIFPMLAGIGALLDEGNTNYSLDAEGGKTFYFYKNGQSGLIEPNGKETVVTKIEAAAYKVKRQVPVAILIDKDTASSGEGIAIAFRGRATTRFFGTHTYGVSTANEGFLLSDGANIVLTTGVGADIHGKIYMSGIAPDETIPSSDKILQPNEDPTIHAALGWLGEQISQ